MHGVRLRCAAGRAPAHEASPRTSSSLDSSTGKLAAIASPLKSSTGRSFVSRSRGPLPTSGLGGSSGRVPALARSLSGSPGMTATLTIKYRQPTPLHTELFFEAELVRVEGRKIFTHGRVFVGDVVTAEAEGLFISVDLAKMGRLLKKREELEARRRAAG